MLVPFFNFGFFFFLLFFLKQGSVVCCVKCELRSSNLAFFTQSVNPKFHVKKKVGQSAKSKPKVYFGLKCSFQIMQTFLFLKLRSSSYCISNFLGSINSVSLSLLS